MYGAWSKSITLKSNKKPVLYTVIDDGTTCHMYTPTLLTADAATKAKIEKARDKMVRIFEKNIVSAHIALMAHSL